TELVVVGPALELDAQPMMGRTLRTARVARHDSTAGVGLPLALRRRRLRRALRNRLSRRLGMLFTGRRPQRDHARGWSRAGRGPERKTALAARAPLHEGRQQREVVRQLVQHALEVALEPAGRAPPPFGCGR